MTISKRAVSCRDFQVTARSIPVVISMRADWSCSNTHHFLDPDLAFAITANPDVGKSTTVSSRRMAISTPTTSRLADSDTL
jgi:hypothetical protein